MMTAVRSPAVSGVFYPAEPEALRAAVDEHLCHAVEAAPAMALAAIGPHAGYRYSGPIAGSTYAAVAPLQARITRVLLIGPSHRVPFTGLATSSVRAFSTPLGDVPVDADAVRQLQVHPAVHCNDRAHQPEHGLEVHLPFIQVALGGDVPIVPVLFGDVSAEDTADALEPLWSESTLLMVSSDLSHYQSYEQARRLDRGTADAIEAGRLHQITGAAACGHTAIQALMLLAERRGLKARAIDLRSSGDTAGPRDQVVGYGAFVYD